ncbi:PAS-domain containing protein [Kiloniella laminariae]|uniref:histidine kinase n=1 Tax=Kiloniella laminariae TaxID=454162 RepID=A0ABT4LF86_9PROT|nr:ATP-binding protein [Kiloniella laminariae]MCZ4279744.1 PAS-domain containing protein [Kiloniella laminariae]
MPVWLKLLLGFLVLSLFPLGMMWHSENELARVVDRIGDVSDRTAGITTDVAWMRRNVDDTFHSIKELEQEIEKSISLARDIYSKPMQAMSFARAAQNNFITIDYALYKGYREENLAAEKVRINKKFEIFLRNFAYAEKRSIAVGSERYFTQIKDLLMEWEAQKDILIGGQGNYDRLAPVSEKLIEALSTIVEFESAAGYDIVLASEDRIEQATRILENIQGASEEVLASSGTVHRSARSAFRTTRTNIAEAEQVLKTNRIISSIGTVSSMLIALALALNIIPPIRRAEAIASNIAAGNLENEIQTRRKDEFGRLFRALDIMQGDLKQKMTVEGARLHEAQARLALVAQINAAIENLPIGVLMVSIDLTVLRYNQNLLMLYGLEEGEVYTGMPVAELVETVSMKPIVKESEREKFIQNTLDFYTTKKPFQIERRFHNGITVDIRGNIVESVGYVITVSDITHLKELQEEMVQVEKMAALGQLVAGVAHEINTPIGLGVTLSSHLEESVKTVQQQFKAGLLRASGFEKFISEIADGTRMISQNLGQASRLVQSFKQVSVDQHLDELRPISVYDYAEDVLRSMHAKFKPTHINIHLAGERDKPIRIYPGAVAQILTNFLTNSYLHAFDDGNRAGNIIITVTQLGDKTRVRYEDDGEGISEAYLNKVFDPFFTTRRGGGGTGLGLHIVYNLVVQKLKSDIRWGSSPGVSTWFEFDLQNIEAKRI